MTNFSALKYEFLFIDGFSTFADEWRAWLLRWAEKAIFSAFGVVTAKTATDFVSTLLYRLFKPVPTQIFCKMTYPSIFSPLISGKSLNFRDSSTEIRTATPLEWKVRLFVLGMGLDVIIGVATSLIL